MKRINNDEAVSPVIGVILMVVITVIIAAVLAVFVFGVGEPEKVPKTKLSFEAVANGTNNTDLIITNDGGDAMVLSELSIKVTDAATRGTIPLTQNNWGAYFSPGMSKTGSIGNVARDTIINVKIMHNPSGQTIADTRVTVR